MKMVRVDDHRLCLVRTSEGVFALAHACPHEGYGMTQGSLDGNLITCAWHNWKFRVDDGVCVVGEEDITTHPVTVDDDGNVLVTLHQPDVETLRPRLLASLRRGIENDYIGQVSRDVVRLLQADANPGELVWEAVNTARREPSSGGAIRSPRPPTAWRWSTSTRGSARPADRAGDRRNRRDRTRPTDQPTAGSRAQLPTDAIAPISPGCRSASNSTALRRWFAPQSTAGARASDLQPWFTAVASDHLLSYGHGAIYCQKAFELLELIGWDRADTVLPHLVPTIVYGTREDLLPYTRPFMRALGSDDLAALSTLAGRRPLATTTARCWRRCWADDRKAIVPAVAAALHAGAGVDGVLDVVVQTVGERMMRYDTAGERDLLDDFGWLDITHGLTYANAARWHHRLSPGTDTVRLAMFTAFLAQWTGRHEWHTHVAERDEGRSFAGSVVEAGDALQREALLDNASAFIVYAHGIKTSRAAAREAARTGSMLPLQAVARLLDSPRLERFVAANVARSIEFLAGRAPHDE